MRIQRQSIRNILIDSNSMYLLPENGHRDTFRNLIGWPEIEFTGDVGAVVARLSDASLGRIGASSAWVC